MKEEFNSLSTLIAEGDKCIQSNDFSKAAEIYTRALSIQPNNHDVLIARANCLEKLGDYERAATDVDKVLKQNPKNHKALLQQANLLYSTGQFEYALVFYYRGFEQRKDVDEFIKGIRKSKIAIAESMQSTTASKKVKESKPLGQLQPDEAFLKKLLQDPHIRTDITGRKTDSNIPNLVQTTLHFLDSRKAFWSSQTPQITFKPQELTLSAYPSRTNLSKARPKSAPRSTKQIISSRPSSAHSVKTTNNLVSKKLYNIPKHKYSAEDDVSANSYVQLHVNCFDIVDYPDYQTAEGRELASIIRCIRNEFHNENFEKALALSKDTILKVQQYSDKNLYLTDIYVIVGTIYSRLNQQNLAIVYFQKAVDLAFKHDLRDAKLKSLTFLAKEFEKTGNYLSAVQLLEKKKQIQPEASDLLQLYQDIGKCYFKLGDYTQALPYLQACLHICLSRPDTGTIQLSVSNYISHILIEQNQHKDALEVCEKNLILAKKLNNIHFQAQALSQISNVYLLLSEKNSLYAERSLYYQKLAMALIKIKHRQIE